MTLRLPDDLDAKLTERARREGRSKQDLALRPSVTPRTGPS
ncbi:ribbon-helix-helix protein, CopG family [Streptomyces violaceus]|uniref:Ribbon-helix-helix protein, CopG family n=1 Tax=Streptomyces violaceus TaxID=1936 RepID=A0ABZ1P6C7_STRVL